MRGFTNFVVGFVAGAIVLAVTVAAYFRMGLAPVAVSAPPMPFEHTLAHAALHAKVEKAANVQPPVEVTEATLLSGARTYRAACAVCHGLPGSGKTTLQKGMYPDPPDLLNGKGVTDDPVGSTHWVVQHGIRMTGMPSFESTFSDTQLWEVSLLLTRAHELPASVDQLLRKPDLVPIETGDGVTPRAAAARQ
jgi:thiosulfate dehydrogenase